MLISNLKFSSHRCVTMSVKTSSVCIKGISLFVLLLFLQPVFSQNWKDELDSELQSKQKQLGTNLVAIVWRNDTIAFKKEMGDFNSKTQVALGNSSAWLTATLVMMFVEEGKLSLDDKVSKWLPEFEKYGKNYITLRLCLAHMTGIEDEDKFFKTMFRRSKFATLEEEVNAFARREIRTNPGQDFWYGSMGPNIAGRVLEIVSKKRFDALIKQRLFNPLTMRRTSFTTIDASALNPSGGAVSTGDDFIQFLSMLLNKGKHKGKQILSEESINTLMTVQTKPELIKSVPTEGQGLNYALGSWVLEEKDGKAISATCPSLFGTWPMISYCKGYALFVMVKEPMKDEPKAAPYISLKEILDGGSGCE
jgi:CubicO group peptidase (beta-lactamase class C family)